MAFLTMYFANSAGVNVGVITTIWSLNPLFMAIADYIFNNQKLHYYHIIGLISITLCCIVISLSGVVGVAPATQEVKVYDTPMWIPVLFGIATPMFFTTNGLLTKHLTSERIGFNASTISFTSYFIVNVIVMIVAIPYWSMYGFSQYLFWLGLVGSIINTLGIVCIQNALSLGPAGPVSAIPAVSAVLLVVVEAVKHSKMLSIMETIGLVLGIYGALILVIPD